MPSRRPSFETITTVSGNAALVSKERLNSDEDAIADIRQSMSDKVKQIGIDARPLLREVEMARQAMKVRNEALAVGGPGYAPGEQRTGPLTTRRTLCRVLSTASEP